MQDIFVLPKKSREIWEIIFLYISEDYGSSFTIILVRGLKKLIKNGKIFFFFFFIGELNIVY